MKKLFNNTPLIKIKYDYKGTINEIYAKLEYYSLTGSIKDRVAYFILEKAIKEGLFFKEMPIVEASSGNMAISLSALGNYFNSPVYIFMPNWVSKERIHILKLFGAHIKTYTKKQGGFLRCVQEADKFSKKVNGFRPNQFTNINNILVHENFTAKEIRKKLKKIDTFISGIGTGGTLTGCGKVFKKLFNTKIVSVIPKTKHKNHRIDGISDGFIPEILEEQLIDQSINIDDQDAINMSIKFSQQLGIGIGISSAANFLACVVAHNGKTVTVFADDNKKYLSLLKNKKKNNKKYISNNVKLLSFEIV